MIWAFSVLLGVLAGAASAMPGAAAELKVGRPFPNMVLPALVDGRPASVSRFKGKKLILHIFASW